MDPDSERAIVRRAYAKQILAAAQVSDVRIEHAFATVRREDFLGPGPWPILRWLRFYVPTPDADPVYLYVDDPVGIVPERRINNGQPSLHARLIAQARIEPGYHVVHIGAGTGYYSAILAHLAGPTGRVTAIEYDTGLAAQAATNLAEARVGVIQGDGAAMAFPPADVIYVNAGVTRPAEVWLDGLKDAGRLILPMTTDAGFGQAWQGLERRGAVFLIERNGPGFAARWISPVAIFPCEGARDKNSEVALAQAFEKGGWDRVTRLYRTDDIADDRSWVKGTGWCLAYN
jgi:protein-L-isoaspartate(D-aspartate) O-methyltransferase